MIAGFFLPLRVSESARQWWALVHLPLALFVGAFLLIQVIALDVPLAQRLFYDSTEGWRGAHSWWTNEFLHDGGRWFVRCVVGSALVLFVASYLGAPAYWRRPSGYFVAACVLGVAIVGLLKTALHVPCPWDLRLFGGRSAYVPLFAHRLHSAHMSGCFPAAHAASGYALSSAYFVLRERSLRGARWALGIAMAIGVIFGIAQQSRGAHFISHDLCSAILVWLTAATIYVFAYRSCLWPTWRPARHLLTMMSPPTVPAPIELPAHLPLLHPPAASVRVLHDVSARRGERPH